MEWKSSSARRWLSATLPFSTPRSRHMLSAALREYGDGVAKRRLEVLAATLPPANVADNEEVLRLVPELPDDVRYLLGDVHYNDPTLRERWETGDRLLHRFEHHQDLRLGLKACLRAA